MRRRTSFDRNTIVIRPPEKVGTVAYVNELLTVAPSDKERGLGGKLLVAVAAELIRRGHEHAVLHLLIDSQAAVQLYVNHGWHRCWEAFEHSLLKRPTQTYVCDLKPPQSVV